MIQPNICKINIGASNTVPLPKGYFLLQIIFETRVVYDKIEKWRSPFPARKTFSKSLPKAQKLMLQCRTGDYGI